MKFVLLPFVACGCLAFLSQVGTVEAAEPILAGPITAEVDRVVDGDTVRVNANIWVDQRVNVSVRLAGIDAPEIFRPKCPAEKQKGLAARDFINAIMGEQTIRLKDVQNGKYAGRVVGRIELADGRDLGAVLIDADLAAPQKPRQKKPDWCGA
ncbi:MAG: thermonuclease family protein [Pseudomonadota bacterium]